MFKKIQSAIFAYKLTRQANKLIKAQKLIEANGFAMVKIYEKGGTFYLENQKDKSLWRLKKG